MKSRVIALREVKAMVREKSFALIILLELLLVSSSGLLSVGYVILTSPESSGMLNQLSSLVYVGVVTDTRLPISQVFEDAGVHHTFYDGLAQARKDFREGLIDAVLVGDVRQGEDPSVLKLIIPKNSPKSSLTKLTLKKALIALEDRLRENKVRLYKPEIELARYEILDYKPKARSIEIYFIFTLPLLLFLPCVVSGSLAIDSLTQDMESKSMLNLITAPVSSEGIVFGKALGSFLLSMVQCVMWLAVLSFTFVAPENHLPLILLCLLYTVLFLNIGCLLGLYLKKMRSSQIIYTFASMFFISLFSPFANIHPLLTEFSPSYIITRMALGANPLVFSQQLVILSFLAAASTVFVAFSAKKVNEI